MANQIEFSAKSMMDDFGRVFLMDGKIYRAIHANQETTCMALINSSLFKELTQKRLIPDTTISDVKVDGYNLVLHHERLTETLQHEWSFSMLKDAALMVLEVNDICNKHGYELKDAHTLNVLFKDCKPMMVDIGSISKRTNPNEPWMAYDEFLASFVVPLILWSRNEIYITRKLLESNFHRLATIPSQNVFESGLASLLFSEKNTYRFKFREKEIFSTSGKRKLLWMGFGKANRLIQVVSGKKDARVLVYENDSSELATEFPYSKMRTTIESLNRPNLTSMWQGYHSNFYSNKGEVQYSPRFLRLLEIIKGLQQVKSVIDLAGNEGLFSKLLNEHLNLDKQILVDYDENAIDVAYQTIRQSETTGINPALINFMFTPDINGTAKRLKSDLAIAMAVTHHLVLTAQYSLPAIFERLKLFSNRYVMVEFMPLGLWALGDKTFPALPEWYTKEWFEQEFSKHFNLILTEKLEDNRIVFLGEIKP